VIVSPYCVEIQGFVNLSRLPCHAGQSGNSLPFNTLRETPIGTVKLNLNYL
jgi:hypothetical protein